MLELRKVSILACVVAMHFSIVVTARGEISASNDGEAASIRAKAQQYLEAKRSGNAAAIREFWTSSGDYVDAVGQVFKPGDLNPQTSAPTVPGSAAEAPVAQSSLRFITPEVAIEDGTYEMGTDDDGSELAGRYTAIWVRSRGTWLLDSLREAMPLSPPANSRLQPLDWLLGERVGTTDDATILVSSHWADGGKYIVREFLVRRARGETVVGTQRIGWDPIAGKIKC